MPDGFRSPFAGKRRRTTEPARDLFGEPDVTADMAAEFLVNCDAFQLPLFASLGQTVSLLTEAPEALRLVEYARCPADKRIDIEKPPEGRSLRVGLLFRGL